MEVQLGHCLLDIHLQWGLMAESRDGLQAVLMGLELISQEECPLESRSLDLLRMAFRVHRRGIHMDQAASGRRLVSAMHRRQASGRLAGHPQEPTHCQGQAGPCLDVHLVRLP